MNEIILQKKLFQAMPDEIIEHFLFFCYAMDLLRLRKVNKQLNGLVTNYLARSFFSSEKTLVEWLQSFNKFVEEHGPTTLACFSGHPQKTAIFLEFFMAIKSKNCYFIPNILTLGYDEQQVETIKLYEPLLKIFYLYRKRNIFSTLFRFLYEDWAFSCGDREKFDPLNVNKLENIINQFKKDFHFKSLCAYVFYCIYQSYKENEKQLDSGHLVYFKYPIINFIEEDLMRAIEKSCSLEVCIHQINILSSKEKKELTFENLYKKIFKQALVTYNSQPYRALSMMIHLHNHFKFLSEEDFVNFISNIIYEYMTNSIKENLQIPTVSASRGWSDAYKSKLLGKKPCFYSLSTVQQHAVKKFKKDKSLSKELFENFEKITSLLAAYSLETVAKIYVYSFQDESPDGQILYEHLDGVQTKEDKPNLNIRSYFTSEQWSYITEMATTDGIQNFCIRSNVDRPALPLNRI